VSIPRRTAPSHPALVQHAEDRAQNVQNRIADTITRFAGSMMFVYVHVIWFGAWIIFKVEHYPFGLLTMIVSLEAIFLSTFVMISQNRADEKRRLLADHQWQIVQEEEQQNEQLLHISNQILELTRAIHAVTAARQPRSRAAGARGKRDDGPAVRNPLQGSSDDPRADHRRRSEDR
jgi:uncharacterized membrane protein